MNENFEYKGSWFLPSNRDKRVYGILKYNNTDRNTLELFGNFSDKILDNSFGEEKIILGITSDSKEITLYRSFIISTGGLSFKQGKEVGFGTTIYLINYILEGTHIYTMEEMKFQSVTTSFQNLDRWTGISGFQHTPPDFSTLTNYETAIKYKLPEPIEFPVNKNVRAKINFTAKPPGWSRYQAELSIKQSVYLIFQSEYELEIEDWLTYITDFQNFLLMGLYDKTYPTEIEFKGNNFYDDFGKGEIILRDIKLYFSIQDKEISNVKTDIDMLFTYQDIESDFPTIISKWFEKYELLRPSFNLVFEQFYNNKRFSENTFLNLAQAAETFHLRTNNHTKTPKSVYENMKKEILRSVDKKYHSWLKEQFVFGNNLNLSQRLEEIIQSTSNSILDKIVGDKQQFADQIRWTRNYYTHYTPNGQKKALKGTPLFHLSEKLKIVLICAFLKEVGFTIEKIEALLNRSEWRLFNHLSEK